MNVTESAITNTLSTIAAASPSRTPAPQITKGLTTNPTAWIFPGTIGHQGHAKLLFRIIHGWDVNGLREIKDFETRRGLSDGYRRKIPASVLTCCQPKVRS